LFNNNLTSASHAAPVGGERVDAPFQTSRCKLAARGPESKPRGEGPADIELIPSQQINTAYERMLKSDVKYRFVIDMASLAQDAPHA
jgi:hypothetical protein